MGTYSCFADLCLDYHEPADFRITAVERAGPLIILAPHGGSIERGTSELARAIAGEDLSLYLFESLRPTAKEGKKLHITSTNFDEPACLRLVQCFPHSLALHGCEGVKPVIYVGGGDHAIKSA